MFYGVDFQGLGAADKPAKPDPFPTKPAKPAPPAVKSATELPSWTIPAFAVVGAGIIVVILLTSKK